MSTLPLMVRDLVGLDDIDTLGAETLTDLETFEQDVYHILLEAPGSNPDDIDRGIGIASLLSGKQPDLLAAASTVDAQLAKDERCHQSTTTIGTEIVNGERVFAIQIEVQVDGSVLGLAFQFSDRGGLIA